MKVLILNALENENNVVSCLKKVLQEKNHEITDYDLKDVHILPCRGCNACNFKSPGKCVFDDDIHPILKTWVESRLIVMTTPIRFGSYASHLKKVLDKAVALALPFYGAERGKMYHLPRYDRKSLLVIGEASENLPGEAENFRKLAAGNAWNMRYECQTLIFGLSDTLEEVRLEMGHVLGRVGA